ncbi:helix-turn-helix domain-containing protein [Streptomyces sp. NPDC017964]|uniref:helix-turn-helix domain-containing protein n=1 Tax=Streptomyces sp. NPDC017964 TaxID=3365022 RepID=UPI0037BE0B90
MTDAGRAARERIRHEAVARFEGGEGNRDVAAVLRVSERSVERWRLRRPRSRWRTASTERPRWYVPSRLAPNDRRRTDAAITAVLAAAMHAEIPSNWQWWVKIRHEHQPYG